MTFYNDIKSTIRLKLLNNTNHKAQLAMSFLVQPEWTSIPSYIYMIIQKGSQGVAISEDILPPSTEVRTWYSDNLKYLINRQNTANPILTLCHWKRSSQLYMPYNWVIDPKHADASTLYSSLILAFQPGRTTFTINGCLAKQCISTCNRSPTFFSNYKVSSMQVKLGLLRWFPKFTPLSRFTTCCSVYNA